MQMPHPLGAYLRILRYMPCCHSYTGELQMEHPMGIMECRLCGLRRYYYLPALFPVRICQTSKTAALGDLIFASNANLSDIGERIVPRDWKQQHKFFDTLWKIIHRFQRRWTQPQFHQLSLMPPIIFRTTHTQCRARPAISHFGFSATADKEIVAC